MRQIEEQFRQAVREQAPDIRLVTSGREADLLTVPGSHTEFGELEIELHDREITFYLGRHTHCHFSAYSDQPAGHHVEEAAQFLHQVVTDQVVVWSRGHTGGCYAVSDGPSKWVPDTAVRFLWSGPVRD